MRSTMSWIFLAVLATLLVPAFYLMLPLATRERDAVMLVLLMGCWTVGSLMCWCMTRWHWKAYRAGTAWKRKKS